MSSSAVVLTDSFKLIMGRLIKILKDYEGMIRIGKEYTGKLENTFAVASSKRLVAIDKDLQKLFSGFAQAEQFVTGNFNPAMKLFLNAVKSAVSGDFSEVELRVQELRRLSVSLVQLMKDCNRDPPSIGRQQHISPAHSTQQQLEDYHNNNVNDIETRQLPLLPPVPPMSARFANSATPDYKTRSFSPTKKATLSKQQFDALEEQNKNREHKHGSSNKVSYLTRGFSQTDVSSSYLKDVKLMENNVIELVGKWKCNSCGVPNTEESYRCIVCGEAKFEDESEAFPRCRQCNAKRPKQSVPCNICGAPPNNTLGNIA